MRRYTFFILIALLLVNCSERKSLNIIAEDDLDWLTSKVVAKMKTSSSISAEKKLGWNAVFSRKDDDVLVQVLWISKSDLLIHKKVMMSMDVSISDLVDNESETITRIVESLEDAVTR